MKLILFVSMIFLALPRLSFAENLQWKDLEVKNQYIINQKISFPDAFDILAGEKLQLIDFFETDTPVLYFKAHLLNCKNSTLSSEMIIINPSPEDTTRDRSVGIQLAKGCNLEIFLEPADFYSPSLFESGPSSAVQD